MINKKLYANSQQFANALLQMDLEIKFLFEERINL